VYSAVVHADDLAALIRTISNRPADLVGASYGGLVALELARRNPELVHSLVLAEPAAVGLLGGSTEDEAQKRAALSALSSIRALLARGDSIGALSAFVSGTGGPANGLDALPPNVRRYFLSQMFEFRREIDAPSDAYLPSMVCGDFANVHIPVLLLRSEHASPLFSRIFDDVARCFPGARLETIANSGHAMSQDNPVDFNKVVLDFLALHRR